MEQARLVAQAVLDRMGRQAPAWTVLHVGWTQQPTVGRPGDDEIHLYSWHSGRPPGLDEGSGHQQLSVVLGSADEAVGGTVTAYYPLYLQAAEAIVVLASQIQDHASEAEISWGRSLPPCPGHNHPLRAHVVEGIAVWECPSTPDHHREPILSTPR